jgi:hypothetical protein
MIDTVSRLRHRYVCHFFLEVLITGEYVFQ